MKLVVRSSNGLEYEVMCDVDQIDFHNKSDKEILAAEVEAAVHWMNFRIDLDQEMKERSKY